jgi:uncharacterized membrane protein YgaE (UPF0421/DUF939 family)
MKKLLIGVFIAGISAFSVSGAVPSRDALKEAHAKVDEAIKDIRTEFENGDKDAVDVAKRALELVEIAENSAQKYLFYKGAMMFFVRAKMYDRAAEIANQMASSRIAQAKETGCRTLITPCPFCKLNLENDEIDVLDLTEFLVKYGDVDGK